MTLAVSGWKIRRPSEPWSVSIGLTTRGMPGSEFSAFLLPSDLFWGNRNLRLFQREPFAGSLLSGKYAVPLLSCSYCLAWNVRLSVRPARREPILLLPRAVALETSPDGVPNLEGGPRDPQGIAREPRQGANARPSHPYRCVPAMGKSAFPFWVAFPLLASIVARAHMHLT